MKVNCFWQKGWVHWDQE